MRVQVTLDYVTFFLWDVFVYYFHGIYYIIEIFLCLCCFTITVLQTLNDMTRSMTAPLVHIKKLAKASNVKVGFHLLLDFHLHSPGKLCFAVIGGGGRPQ